MDQTERSSVQFRKFSNTYAAIESGRLCREFPMNHWRLASGEPLVADYKCMDQTLRIGFAFTIVCGIKSGDLEADGLGYMATFGAFRV